MNIEHCIEMVNHAACMVEEVRNTFLKENKKENMELFIYLDSLNTSMRKAKNDAEQLSWILGTRR